jgi:glutamine amidotransferase
MQQCLLSTPHDLFALRYPDTHNLFVLHRAAGGPHGHRHLDLPTIRSGEKRSLTGLTSEYHRAA